MCGIAGIINLNDVAPPEEAGLRRMLGMIRHRGPDEFGMYIDDRAALGSARLSIIDLAGGQQPISNEDDTLWIVFNGEIFNYVELRHDLEARGHRFKTSSDTEVILHAFEEMGPGCLAQFNGQFAIAIWNSRDQTLFLARDRVGVRPLFYAQNGGALLFGSEIKALLAEGRLSAQVDPAILHQIFTFWSPLGPSSPFRGIVQLPPGRYLLAGEGQIKIKPYWDVSFGSETGLPGATHSKVAPEELAEELLALLVSATKIRLRADVPVGAYLSGGLDSSAISSIIRRNTSTPLNTFSIAFDDAQFDESRHQLRMAEALGVKHHVLRATHDEIGRVFPDVVWHAETVLMRTAPAPMFLLSQLVRDNHYKVVLTGEGADEFLAGYDIFKEAKVRRFWAQQPQSKWRPLLLNRLYSDISGLSSSDPAFLSAFFSDQLTDLDHPFYSHLVRWRNNQRTCRFFSEEVRAEASGSLAQLLAGIELPPTFSRLHPLERAQYLEVSIFLSQYLLSSQGDRMAMAHSVEGRFPFLDHRIIEFCNKLPARVKLRGLTEKHILKMAVRHILPAEISQRSKRAYRAPIQKCFFNQQPPDYVRELLSPAQLKKTALFQPAAVAKFMTRLTEGKLLGETDSMALTGILSAQLLHFQFVENFRHPKPIGEMDRIKVCLPNQTTTLN